MEADFDARVQRRAEQHLEACQDELFDKPDDSPESPASAPFCGCTTCVVREVLSVTWDEMWAEVQRVAK